MITRPGEFHSGLTRLDGVCCYSEGRYSSCEVILSRLFSSSTSLVGMYTSEEATRSTLFIYILYTYYIQPLTKSLFYLRTDASPVALFKNVPPPFPLFV